MPVQVQLAGRQLLELHAQHATAEPWLPLLRRLNIPAGKYNIMFSVYIRKALPGIYALIDNIKIEPGKCQDTGKPRYCFHNMWHLNFQW